MNSEEKKSCDLCDDAGPLYLHARCHLTAPLKAAMEDFEINRDWKFYQEPKPKKLVAPALFYSNNEDERWVLSDSCFEDLETAKKYFKPTYKVVWPAVPNAQGFFEVPE